VDIAENQSAGLADMRNLRYIICYQKWQYPLTTDCTFPRDPLYSLTTASLASKVMAVCVCPAGVRREHSVEMQRVWKPADVSTTKNAFHFSIGLSDIYLTTVLY